MVDEASRMAEHSHGDTMSRTQRCELEGVVSDIRLLTLAYRNQAEFL